MKKEAILRIIRIIAWAVIAVLVVYAFAFMPKPATQKAIDIGGAYTLSNTKGDVVTEKTFLGKPTLYFFGFTNCPMICPTTLADMTQWLETLGADADKINTVFVTIDPARDDAKRMAEYLTAFDKHIVGLTGTKEQVDGIAKAFQLYTKRVDEKGSEYTLDHTATVFLLGRDGKLISTIDSQEDKNIALAKIRKAME